MSEPLHQPHGWCAVCNRKVELRIAESKQSKCLIAFPVTHESDDGAPCYGVMLGAMSEAREPQSAGQEFHQVAERFCRLFAQASPSERLRALTVMAKNLPPLSQSLADVSQEVEGT